MTHDHQAASHLEAQDTPPKKTAFVNAYRVSTGRVEFMEVTWEEYVELYDRKFLKFLREGTPRPDHLPDRETAKRWASIKTPEIIVKPKNNGWGESFAGKLRPTSKLKSPKPIAPAIIVEEEPEADTAPAVVAAEEVIPEVPTHFQEQEELPSIVLRRRKKPEKVAALEKVSAELRKNKPQLEIMELLEAAAKELRMTPPGLHRFWLRFLNEDERNRLLYGEGGTKLTRAEEKFAILMALRDKMRKKGKPPPTKAEFIEAAGGLLKITLEATRTYIYSRLTEEQIGLLEFAPPAPPLFTKEEQLAIIKGIRQEMRGKGLPAPRQKDLAAAAAPLLKLQESSTVTLINSFGKEVKEELEFVQSRQRTLVGHEATTVREGFLGAIAVLKLRRMPLTAFNLRIVLRLKPAVIDKYLAEHPDIKDLMKGAKKQIPPP